MFTENNFHFIGIGGIGMSGLARILRGFGKNISGSDNEASPITAKLKEEGILVTFPQAAQNIPLATEVVIYTLAVKSDNSEMIEAQKRGLRILSYPEALGEAIRNKKVIAVAGAHGKTTTTGLLISACLQAGEDVSCLVGSNLRELNAVNARVGKSDWFIIEACEYKRAFLNFNPEILAITNIEAEHLDYYKDLEDYVEAFLTLAKQSRKVVVDSREANMVEIQKVAKEFFDASEVVEEFLLQIPGEHNRKNASLAYRVCEIMGINLVTAKAGMEKYSGAWRRFEYRGEFQSAKVYDDYAHHPTEIRATLSAARERFPQSRIVIVYQQHQLDRATKMLHELGKSFFDADIVVIPNIYFVRDEADSVSKISGEDIAAEIRANGKEAYFTENFENTITWLKQNITAGDLLLIVGAGDIFHITEKLLKN
ncbi:MAG: Mur ligase domain-containing protein [Candidatus Gracilibacteria bacterium]|jgi:UDP-N-acetylmuramate--alanine ligase